MTAGLGLSSHFNVPALLPLIAMLFPETQVLGEKVSQLKMLLIYGAAG